tara:strand:+ start:17061 stop:17234 length:174 start_codon:yes stop_codon:yes gene_type:complete
MYEISEEYLEEHETERVKCLKCNSTDVIAKTNEGYFWIEKCNKCGYTDKNHKNNEPD